MGKKLKKLRKILKITQDKFVNKCGIHRTTYNHNETGYSIIKTMAAYSICKTYKVSMDWLMGKK